MAEPTEERRLPQPGDVIVDKHRVEAVLGQGGMGIVMKATGIPFGGGPAGVFASFATDVYSDQAAAISGSLILGFRRSPP